jgi:hypothetical protein
MKRDILIAEYTALRAEVTERVKMLHLMLTTAVLLQMVALIVYFIIVDIDALRFALTIPIIFAVLTFNYQANQMTLEQVAGYSDHLRRQLAGDASGSWDEAYGKLKKKYKLTSFLKVWPLLAPMILPFIFLLSYGGLTPDSIGNTLIIVDVLLFLMVIVNFRYKLYRD